MSVSVSNCSFPGYGFPGAAAGAGGSGGLLVSGATSGSAGVGGSSGASGSGTDAGTAGEIEEGGAAGASASGGSAGDGFAGDGFAGDGFAGAAGSAAGAGEEPCVFPTPRSYPQHCFNKTAGDGESGVDCGGTDCAPCSSNQACTQASDCLSNQCSSNKTCAPSISLTYTPIETGALTRTPKFKLNITYLDSVMMPLSDFTIRYYYNHNRVTEPIIGFDSQATIDPGNMQLDISTKVLTSVHRFPAGPKDGNGLNTDSYLEIAFNDSMMVTNGTKFVINQDLMAGSSDQLFDQNSHYSFTKTTGANFAVTVYRGEQRLWGVEPPLAQFPACALAVGVNLNGPALTVSGEALLAEAEAQLSFNGGAPYTSTGRFLPSTDASTATLLATGRTLSTGDSLLWSVPDGQYWAYVWLSSAASSDTGTLSFGTSVADKFAGANGSPRWGLLGPYSVDVRGSALQVTVDGGARLAGMKLYERQR